MKAMYQLLKLILHKPFFGAKNMAAKISLMLFLVFAPLLFIPQTAVSKDPIFFELDQIRIQYYQDLCGYRMVAINVKLEYYDFSISGRLQRFEPKIMSLLFFRLSEYFNKVERPSNNDLEKFFTAKY